MLLTKLMPPSSARRLVRRPRLQARSLELARTKLALVRAPAGFGKTTLLRQWYDALRSTASSGLTKAAALDSAKAGIRVNALAPGLVETPMTARWLADPATSAALMANSPIDEMAGMVLLLCSDDASFATGGEYLVDGGQTAH